MTQYWDPIPAMVELLASPPEGHVAPWTAHGRNSSAEIFTGAWDARDWRNVPGPFYAAATDTCGGGRALAPDLVLVNDDWTEFVFRQPADHRQILQLLDAAYDDPFGEYACDGHDHWNPEEIRRWWADRGRVLQWIESATRLMLAQNAGAEVASLRGYAADIDGPLEARLRHYAYWLDNGAAARPHQRLPDV